MHRADVTQDGDDERHNQQLQQQQQYETHQLHDVIVITDQHGANPLATLSTPGLFILHAYNKKHLTVSISARLRVCSI